MNSGEHFLTPVPTRFLTAVFYLFLLLPTALFASPQSEAGPADAPGNVPANAPAKPDPAAGKPVFERHCSPCHGISGDGGRGPRLNRSYLPHASDDNELRSVIENGIPPGMPDASYLSKEEIANVAAHIRSLAKLPGEILAGDSAHGAEIYARSGCSACHIYNGKGIGFGPELTGIGDRRSASFIKSVISDPAVELPDGFLVVTVVLASGKSITGIRLNEDTFSIQIKDNRGQIYSFRKKNSQQLKRETGKTPMPSFREILSPSDLQDLAVFLASSRQTP
jgi:cytochrome c oxidase cbb3-type subunit III